MEPRQRLLQKIDVKVTELASEQPELPRRLICLLRPGHDVICLRTADKVEHPVKPAVFIRTKCRTLPCSQRRSEQISRRSFREIASNSIQIFCDRNRVAKNVCVDLLQNIRRTVRTIDPPRGMDQAQ